MKIKIQMVVEVDAEQWSAEYGVEKSEVATDVRRYFCNGVELAPVPVKLISSNISQGDQS